MACPSVLLPTGLAVIALGLTIVLALHAHRPRLITVRVAGGVAMVAAAAVLAGRRHLPGPATVDVLVGAVLLPGGLFVIARAVKAADRPVEVVGDVTRARHGLRGGADGRHGRRARLSPGSPAAAFDLYGYPGRRGRGPGAWSPGSILALQRRPALHAAAAAERGALPRAGPHRPADRPGQPPRPAAGAARAGAAGRPARAGRHRPGRLQDGQRHARPRRRRRGAGRGGRAAAAQPAGTATWRPGSAATSSRC